MTTGKADGKKYNNETFLNSSIQEFSFREFEQTEELR